MNTNFAGLTSDQKTVWSSDIWQDVRDMLFIKKFLGTGTNSMIQRIKELTKTEKGERALMFLVADLVGDGTIGDNERTGNEEELKSYDMDIVIDLIANTVINKGKLSDQKSVINFREQAKDKLAYWLANRLDQLAFLTMSGIDYSFNNNGSPRTNSQFINLAFAQDVSAPTANRHVNWNGTGLEAGDTSAIDNTYVPNYKMLVALGVFAKTHHVKPLMAGGKEYFVLLVQPGTLGMLKTDADYQRAVVTGLPRSEKNPFFTGGTVMVDGLVIHEHNLVYNTIGAASGSKWGATGTTEGTRTLLCGAQALGMIDLGTPDWVEEGKDYKTKQGISVDKMIGFKKSKFHSIYDDSVEDFGIVACDHFLEFV